jgi:hypothetical protein
MKGKTGKKSTKKCPECGMTNCNCMACGGKVKMAKGGGVKVRGCGAATKGTRARGPMA